MKRFVKNFNIYFLFVFVQALFIFSDYIYINIGEPLKVHVNLFVVTVVITILTLSIRTIFEAAIIKGVSVLFKKSDSLRGIVKILINSMKLPVILTVTFLAIQLTFIQAEAPVYQVFATSCINLFYMIIACINLKKNNNTPAFYGFALYGGTYIALQAYNIYTII